MTLLRIENLQKAFGSLVVTRDLNLVITAGERHALIGPNGAGKTSLLHQIGGQLRPSAGRILFRGRDITGASPDVVCRLGIARTFQQNSLFRGLSARENVRLAIQAHQGPLYDPLTPVAALREHRERAEALLRRVGLAEGLDRTAASLSYGEQRQLEIALALASEPALLLLDEPTAGMSPAETERMIELIRGLPRSLGILMIEHDMQVVFSLADRITVLYYGEIIASGTGEEIRADPRVHEIYLGSPL
ncbi:MAG TPA: ABC transporter ATP-binding protein [Alphaproteobacteria bacterium]